MSDNLMPRLLTDPNLLRYCPHAPTERQTVGLIADRFLPNDEPSEVFYGGAAGGGKSDWLLMGALEYVDIPGYAAIVFRRSYTDLSLPGAIMHRAQAWLANTDAHWDGTDKQWTFPSGAILQFAYLKNPGDQLRYQSAEFQYVGFDELTQFQEDQYTYLFSRLRRPADGPLAGVPLRQRGASNPGGVGHGWVKDRFPIDGKPRDKRIFIPAKIADNPHLDAVSYRAGLSRLGETLQKQLEDGDWEVAEGLAYRITTDHIVQTFGLHDSHDRFEACDYGLNGAPWALWAVDYEGNLIATDLLYERDLLPSDLAPLVHVKRKSGWGYGHGAFADPSIWHRTGQVNRFGDPAMLVDEFTDNGIALRKANNDPRAGMTRLRELLKLDEQHRFPSWHPRAGEPGAPRLFFVGGLCEPLVKELKAAPLQPIDKPDGGEKVDPAWESRYGHAAAMARYAVMTRPRPSKEPEAWMSVPPHLRKEWDIDPEESRRELLRKSFENRERDRTRRSTERV